VEEKVFYVLFDGKEYTFFKTVDLNLKMNAQDFDENSVFRNRAGENNFFWHGIQ
jgi:hypothetical protein